MGEAPGAERLWQLTVEHSPVGMTLVDPDGTLLSANRALCAMLGRTEDELRGTHLKDLTHPDDLPEHLALYDATIAGERSSYRITKRCVRADGSTVWGDLSVALLRDDAGKPLHLIGQVLDVTEARDRQEQLSTALDELDRAQRRSQAILDSADVGLALMDRDGWLVESNRRHGDFVALAYPDGHRGRAGQVGEVYAADGVAPLAQDDLPTMRAQRGEEFDDYRTWIGSDPVTRRAVSVSARTVKDADGAFAGAALAYNDITDLMTALRSRESFLATVSHELRTPLTSVIGHLEMLLDGTDVDDEVADRLRVVQRNAARLHFLVADLLESAQQRDGGLVLTRTTEDLALVVAECVESAELAARASGVHLSVELPGAAPALVDRERVRQVVDNLITNAVKYSERGGTVVLRLRVQDDQVELTVTDTGIGIEVDDLDKVFTPFYRSREARERVIPGVGLGLGIVRTIVLAHRGTIDVVSTPGTGTSVTVRLPV